MEKQRRKVECLQLRDRIKKKASRWGSSLQLGFFEKGDVRTIWGKDNEFILCKTATDKV